MSQPKRRPSLGDIKRQRDRADFVGRDQQIDHFRQNLALRLDDGRRRFIYGISGQGGVGKTTLLRQYRALLEQHKAAVAYIDEAITEVPAALAAFSSQLAEQGHKLNRFDERYRTYRQRRQELEADPDRPSDTTAFVGTIIGKVGVKLARRIPIGGAIFDLVDEDQFALQVGQWSDYVRRKLTNRDEVNLLLEPVETLTPLFLDDLWSIPEDRLIALFIDTFEQTGAFLEPWLLELLNERHGQVPPNLLITIAGRHELNPDRWSEQEALLVRFALDPFTEDEARHYLSQKGITNEDIIDIILKLSGCLPLLVATLAAQSPTSTADIGDPSDSAVERFLKWVDDPRHRQVALIAALPRTFDRDIIACLTSAEDADPLFDWLKTMPFVQEYAGAWRYHPVVRLPMLRYSRQRSQQQWTERHTQLATWHETRRTALGLDDDNAREDDRWQKHNLERIYHCLAAAPDQHLTVALEDFLALWRKSRNRAQEWVVAVAEIADLVTSAQLRHWSQQIAQGVAAHTEKDFSRAADLFQSLGNHTPLSTATRAAAYDWSGDYRKNAGQTDAAIQAYTSALALVQDRAIYWADRGTTYRQIGRYDDALVDLDKAIELKPDYQWALASRGETYRLMERYEEALSDFDKALQLRPKDQWALAIRGETYRQMDRYEEALADFDKVIQLKPDFYWVLSPRGATYAQMGRYEEVLADLDKAIQLKHPNIWIPILNRALTYLEMGAYERALTEFNTVIGFKPNYQKAVSNRGVVYLRMGRYKEALADFEQALQLKPEDEVTIVNRAVTYVYMGRYEEALINFNSAIALKPEDTWTIARRGITYSRMGRYEEALDDFNQATDELHELDWRKFQRSLTLFQLHRNDAAKEDVAAAIQIAQREYDAKPEDWRNRLNLAIYLLVAYDEQAIQHYQAAVNAPAPTHIIREAIQDLTDLLVVFPNHTAAQQAKALLKTALK